MIFERQLDLVRGRIIAVNLQGAKYQYAMSLLACGQLGEKLGKHDARKQIQEADKKLAEFDRLVEQANRKAMKYLGLDGRDHPAE